VITFLDKDQTKKEGKSPEPYSVKIRSPFRAYWLCGDNERELMDWRVSLTTASQISIYDIKDSSRFVCENYVANNLEKQELWSNKEDILKLGKYDTFYCETINYITIRVNKR
jgi:hypothetical protein